MSTETIVTTADGKRHRVIYESKGQMLVKCAEGKSRPAYKINVARVVKRETQAKTR